MDSLKSQTKIRIMKKIFWLLLLLIGLGALVYFLQAQREQSGKIDLSDRQFAYEDVDDIARIELAKPETVTQIFVKEGGKWYVNDLLVADYKITTLLKGISSSRVENIPPVAAGPEIAKSMKENGIHVSLFDKSGTKLRGYTIGPDALNDRCTYALLDGKSQYYCLNISGFGSIRTRFVHQTKEWRDVGLYRISSDDIASVKVEYHKDYLSSFQIDRSGSTFEVIDIGGKTTGKKIDQGKVNNYLSSFEELFGEGYENDYYLKDSIRQLIPFATVSVTRTDGTNQSMKLFPLEELRDPTDRVSDAQDALNQERYFLDMSTGDFMMAQQRQIKEVLRPYDYFLEK